VSILNLSTPFFVDDSLEFLGGGSYGHIYAVNVFGKRFACKNAIYEDSDILDSSNEDCTVYH
jgi:hypothetical protein